MPLRQRARNMAEKKISRKRNKKQRKSRLVGNKTPGGCNRCKPFISQQELSSRKGSDSLSKPGTYLVWVYSGCRQANRVAFQACVTVLIVLLKYFGLVTKQSQCI